MDGQASPFPKRGRPRDLMVDDGAEIALRLRRSNMIPPHGLLPNSETVLSHMYLGTQETQSLSIPWLSASGMHCIRFSPGPYSCLRPNERWCLSHECLIKRVHQRGIIFEVSSTSLREAIATALDGVDECHDDGPASLLRALQHLAKAVRSSCP